MPTVVSKLFARQGTGRTDGQSGDYMLPPLASITIAIKLIVRSIPFIPLCHKI